MACQLLILMIYAELGPPSSGAFAPPPLAPLKKRPCAGVFGAHFQHQKQRLRLSAFGAGARLKKALLRNAPVAPAPMAPAPGHQSLSMFKPLSS